MIKFWKFNSKGEQVNSKANLELDTLMICASTKTMYFVLEDEDFKNKTDLYEFKTEGGKCIFGIATMPVKLRFGNRNTQNKLFEYSSDISLAAMGGVRFRISHFHEDFLNLLISTGISTISLDSLNTGGFQIKSITASAFNWSLGTVMELSGIQFGLYVGWDYTSGELSRHWVYNKDPWLSLGIGAALFSRQDKNNTTNESKKRND